MELSTDIFHVVLRYLPFSDIVTCRRVNRHWRSSFILLERAVADHFASTVLRDATFWDRALTRPNATSHPLRTWHMEMVRIVRFYNFMLRYESVALDAPYFYTLWRFMDSSTRTPSATHPCRSLA